jgi:hypothetical protein
MTFEPNVQLNKHIQAKVSKVIVVDPVTWFWKAHLSNYPFRITKINHHT